MRCSLIGGIDNGKRQEIIIRRVESSREMKYKRDTYLIVIAAVERRGTVAVAAVATVGAHFEVDCGTQPGTEKVHTQLIHQQTHSNYKQAK